MAETQQQKLAREMSHKHGKVDQSARDNPLTGSAMQALARGWLAGTIGIPGDLEGLGRMGLNALGAGVDKHAALPTTDFFKEWLPGKQTGDENVATVGSMLGGAGVGTARQAVRNAAKAAPGALTQMARNAAMPRQLSAQAGVIKAPGGNWLSGSVEDALKGLKRGEHENEAVRAIRAVRPELSVEDARAFIQAVPVDPKDAALNQFIDKQLTKYVKNDMATERDPVRALAERGVLHDNSVGETWGRNFVHPTGEHYEKLAKNPLAQGWENASDNMLRETPMSEYQNFGSSNLTSTEPWLQTLDPSTPMYRPKDNTVGVNLGFNHLIDELRNATNPASGLPRELLLKPESLERVSVPQAVEHVAKINAWREQQAILAKAAAAEGIPVHKEYKEGFKWLSIPDTEADKKALKYAMDVGCEGGWCTQGESTAKHYGGGEGGRLHVLVDKNGKAHVQIHERPSRSYGTDHLEKFRTQAQEEVLRSGLAPGTPDDPSVAFLGAVNRRMDELAKENLPVNITQIKGKGNKKPNDEYLPFVQDFVKSGKWSDVDDLQNTGLVPYTRGKQHVPRGLTGRTTTGVPFDEVGIPEGYYAEDELLNLMRQWQERSGNKPNFAEGGAVGPTDAEIQQFYAAHKDDPAALAAAMQQYGVGTNAAAKALGQTQEQLVAHVNSGRVATPVMSGGWDGGDTGARTWNYDAITPEVTQSLDQFKQKYAHAIGPDGRFKGPQSGIDYAAEGMTPEEYYKARIGQQYQRSGEYGLEQTPTVFNTEVNADWRPGPDNGGGVLGGLGRAVTGLAKGVMSNPALSMALTAGLAPMVGKGLQSAGMSAGMAKTAAPLVSNAVKTVAGGGSLADAAKNAGIGYLGGQAGQLTEGATGMDFAGKVASSVTQAALRGKAPSLNALATQYAMGQITDLSGLDPKVASIVMNLAKAKRPSAGGALSAMANVFGGQRRPVAVR